MVQTALNALLDALSSVLALARPLALVAAGLLLALILVGLLDRERFRAGLNWVGARLPLLGRWALVALAVGAGALALNVTRRAVDARLGAQQSARYANAADPDGGQTTQQAPRASLLTTTTYTRSIELPDEIYTVLQINGGWEKLLPYFGNPTGVTVQDLQEGFTRRGDTLTYTRDVTLQTEQPVNLDTSKVTADLKFVDPAGGRGTYYNAVFNADYTFTNPQAEAATLRFAFPLPDGSGTLSGFKLTVNGQAFRASDLAGGSIWTGEVAAGQTVRVNVTYRHQGAKGWSYLLGQRRESVKNFDLTINADRPAKFQRYTLFPTSQTRSALGTAQVLRWQLQDVITAQDVAVVFTQGSLRETLGKLGLVGPLAVLLAALLCGAWAGSRRLKLLPLPLAGAVLGLSLGLVLGGVLTFYLPVLLAQLLGVLAGLALAITALGRRYLVPLALAAVIPLVFLSGGHASLLLVLLAGVTLVLFLRNREVGRAVPGVR
jgi:hypothetical protein